MTFFREKLSNGATFIGDLREGFPAIAAIGIPQGSVHDRPGFNGEGHLLEHMLFKAKDRDKVRAINQKVENKGGGLNAGTDFTCTTVQNTIAPRYGELGVDGLLELASSANFAPEHLGVERKVIFEEMGGAKNDLWEYVGDQVPRLLFNGAYARDIRGTKESVQRCTTRSLKELWAQGYHPSTFVVAIAGGHDKEAIRKLVEARLASHPLAIRQQIQASLPEAKKIYTHLQETRAGIEQARVVFATHAPTYTEELMPALVVLDNFLTEGFFSELFKQIREKRGLAYSVKGILTEEKYHGTYFVHVPTNPSNRKKVLTLIKKGFEKATRIDTRTIRALRDKVIDGFDAEPPNLENMLLTMMDFEVNGKSAEEYYQRKAKIQQVTAEQVRYLAQRALDEHSTYVLMPK